MPNRFNLTRAAQDFSSQTIRMTFHSDALNDPGSLRDIRDLLVVYTGSRERILYVYGKTHLSTPFQNFFPS